MEVPSSAPSVSSPPVGRSVAESTGSRADQGACRFLTDELAPYLHRSRRTVLARAVRTAAASGTLASLTKLPERQRRELLEILEARLDATRHGPSPTVVVRLTSAIALPPESDHGLGRRVASPAR